MAESEYFECPVCGKRSYNRHDIDQGYCAHCRDWTGEKSADEAPDEIEEDERISRR